MAGSAVLLNIDMFSLGWPAEMTSVVLDASSVGSSHQGFFDWVELNSLEGVGTRKVRARGQDPALKLNRLAGATRQVAMLPSWDADADADWHAAPPDIDLFRAP